METETWRGTEYPSPGEWKLTDVELETVTWEHKDGRFAYLFADVETEKYTLAIDDNAIFQASQPRPYKEIFAKIFRKKKTLWKEVNKHLKRLDKVEVTN